MEKPAAQKLVGELPFGRVHHVCSLYVARNVSDGVLGGRGEPAEGLYEVWRRQRGV